MRRIVLAVVIALQIATCVYAGKKDVSEAYKHKFLVVMRDGLALAVCSKTPTRDSFLHVRITEAGVDLARHGIIDGMLDSDCSASPEQVQKGEIIKSHHAALRGKWLVIYVESVSPHAVTRGIGAFQHESYEAPSAILMFSAAGGAEQAVALVDQWMKVFGSQEEAVRFGNTASGVFVKQVTIGMSFAEVESALGLPQTRVDLQEKVLYKYKDMTVEFHDGKVADVR
jgi:hypothetical protein